MNNVYNILYLREPPVVQISMDFRAMSDKQFQIVAEQVNQLNGGLLQMVVSQEQLYRAKKRRKDNE